MKTKRMDDHEKLDRIREIVYNGNDKLVDALRDLATWHPSARRFPLKAVSIAVNGDDSMYEGDRGGGVRDEDCSFMTEAFLYNLLGKEDARSLLSMFHSILEAAGLPLDADEKWLDADMQEVERSIALERQRQERREMRDAR